MNFLEFEKFLSHKSLVFNEYLDFYFLNEKQSSLSESCSVKLYDSALYSLKARGKRFRPLLALCVGEVFKISPRYLLRYALALECSHVCSLIEDDLPCMDDSFYRRGKVAHHKVYGEAISLLVSNSLLIESFNLVAGYRDRPQESLETIRLLSKAGSFKGMMSGQVMDLAYLKNRPSSFEQFKKLHYLKTGLFISLSLEGAGVLCRATKEERKCLKAFGERLGLCFQMKDDLLDRDYDGNNNVVSFLGEAQAFKALDQFHTLCEDELRTIDRFQMLSHFVTWNKKRNS